MLSVRVIGGIQAHVDGDEVDLASAARARGLLAWLAVHPGTHPRSILAGRLRPVVPDDSARKSLRQAAWSLRTALGDAGGALVGDRERLGLSGDPAMVLVDLAEFRRMRDGGDLAGAVAVGDAELLAGLDEEWAPALREAHRAEVLTLLGRLADDAAADGDLAGAAGWARRQVAADPLSEIAARRLIALLARDGDRAGALAAFDALRERLRRDLGVPVSAETRELAETVRRGGHARAAGAGGAAHPPLPPPLLRTGPFVGRADAAARIGAAWRDAVAGPRVVMLAGEPGIGKTRLAAHVAAGVHAGGARVLYGRCDEDTLVPHQPFVEALERHLAALPAAERDETIGAVRADLGRVLPVVAPPEEAAGPGDDPDTARYRAFEAVRVVLQVCAAGRPTLLVLDDLHWADRPTLLLLRHLGRMLEPVPLLVVGTYRDTEVDTGHPLAATLGDLRRDHPVVTVTLGGLADEEVADLVRAGDGAAGEAAAREAAALAARARGNPLFVRELVRDLREGGDGGALPERVADVVSRRVDRLGDAAAEVLITAALLGPEFDTDVLEELHGADAALDTIERARGAGLLAETAPAGARHTFTHALVADALASRPSGLRRARLHGRIGAILGARAETDPARYAADAARHLVAAGGDPEGAVRWSMVAAARATELLADDEAAGHWRDALAALGDGDPRRGPALAALGEALTRAGTRGAAQAPFDDAAAAARAAGDPELMARAALGAGGLGVTIGRADPRIVGLLEEALAMDAADADPVRRARLLGRLAVELYYDDRPRADALSREAVAFAEAAGDAGALAAALNARRVAIWDLAHMDERRATAEAMIAAARAAGEPATVLQGRNWRVLDLMEAGEVEELEAEIARYAAEADRLGLPHHRWYVPLWRSALAILRGDTAAGAALAEEARRLGARAEDPNADLFVRIQRGQMLGDAGRAGEIDRAFVEGRIADPRSGWAWATWLAWIEAASGDLDAARARIDALARDGFACVTLDANWHAVLDLCDAVALVGDRERAAVLRDMLAPHAGRVGAVARAALCCGPVDLYLARLALVCDDPAAAAEHARRALAWCERAGAEPGIARARADLDGARVRGVETG
ncbi:MAG TPA: AAA family ATPase [Miltoncostaeaceae bacterium]|mgnify:CR=1 FL=1|nr:AAA family ATPase [Miltoncostaeaceae bacterium]